MTVAALLAEINRRHATTFTLGPRYPGGESTHGAYAVHDAAGHPGVLKLWECSPDFVARQHEIGAATARLRERGYPAPRYLAVGCTRAACYCVQERLPGAPLRTLTPALLANVLELNALQRGQALPGPRDWPRRIVATVLEGGDGYCLLEPLRAYSAETAELLCTLQAMVTRHKDERCETGDLVHYDFNPANLLVQDGAISGVIDWQDPCSGDCTFDLATLLLYVWETPDMRGLLWAHALERAGPGVLGIYLAHMILRQVDWAIRHHRAAATAAWLRTAGSMLGACRAAEDKPR
jgi:hypothetical protein